MPSRQTRDWWVKGSWLRARARLRVKHQVEAGLFDSLLVVSNTKTSGWQLLAYSDNDECEGRNLVFYRNKS